MTQPSQLDVFHGEQLVGHVYDTAPLSFAYSTYWLQRPEPMAVAAIPLAPGRQDHEAVQAFFENLLPEGELRTYIAEQNKASTLFSLLKLAGDTASGFVILPAGQTPQAPSYEGTTWAKLGATLKEKSAAAIDIKGKGARISLAGAQDKASIAIFADGIPMLPKGTSPSTHILKPDIRRLAKVWESAANEALIMRTAALCGLPTADVFYQPDTHACIVKRFDRIALADSSLGRLIQYDMCQLSATQSEKKYEKEGGPGIAECAMLIRKYSSQPAVDLRNFVNWIFFNLYVGNNDSHAKNLSIYRLPDKRVILTPFYDLMCTRIYPGLSQEFAFAVGGEVMPGNITRQHIEEMARQLGMRPAFVFKSAKDLADKLPAAIDQAIDVLQPDMTPNAQTFIARLQKFVISTMKKTVVRISEQEKKLS